MDRPAFTFELSAKYAAVLCKLLTCYSRLGDLMNGRVVWLALQQMNKK